MKILFLCVANSARSQMAEGLAKTLFGNQAEILSAGSEPTRVNPFAIQAMHNMGIDISTHHSKAIRDVLNSDIDYVITLCADEVCPVFSGHAKRLHWPFSDPAGHSDNPEESLARFEKVRDQIKAKLHEFKDELSNSGKI